MYIVHMYILCGVDFDCSSSRKYANLSLCHAHPLAASCVYHPACFATTLCQEDSLIMAALVQKIVLRHCDNGPSIKCLEAFF